MTGLQYFSHFPISLNLSSSSSSSSQIKPCISPILCSTLPSLSKHIHHKPRNQTAPKRSKFRDGVDPVQESGFFDENGVVEDMDRYLNYLSLEYDSVWDTKPSWCQPWTITLTGIGIVTCSWLVLNSAVVTSLVGFLICAWWYIFLYSYPKAKKAVSPDYKSVYYQEKSKIGTCCVLKRNSSNGVVDD